MFAQPSPDESAGSSFEQETEPPVQTTAPEHADASHYSELLNQVLGETLVRNQENPQQLLDSLRQWRSTLAVDQPCGADAAANVVRQVLTHRLGSKASLLPDDLCKEVGAALWDNADGRIRLQRLWTAMETST